MSQSPGAQAVHPQNAIVQAIAVSSLIHLISNRMTATGTNTYAQFGLGFLEARILYVLPRSGPMPASRLSLSLGVHPAAISRSVTGLLERRLVEKRPGPKRNLVLTEPGAALSEAIAAVFEERCLKLVAGLDERELALLHQALERLRDNLFNVAAVGGATGPLSENA